MLDRPDDDTDAPTAARPWPGWGLVLPLLAALPSLVGTVHAVRAGWFPIADDGIISLRAFDVLTGRSPSLGQMSLASEATGTTTRSPGPLGYWLVSPSTHIGPGWAPAVATGLLSGAAAVAATRVARRIAGLPLMVAVAVGCVLAARTFGVAHLASVWNPSMGLVPMALLALLAWAVALGDRRLFPATVVVASLTAQLHLTFLLPSVAAVGVATLGFLPWGRPAEGDGGGRLPTPWRGWRGEAPWCAGGVLVAVVAWAVPLAQQLRGDPGNLTLVLRASTTETGGARVAGQTLAWGVGVPPAFVDPSRTGFERLVALTPPWWSLQVVGAGAFLLALVAVGILGAVRRERRALAPVLVVVAVAAGAALTFSRTPTAATGISILYTSLWMAPFGLVAWCAVVVGALALRRAPASGEASGEATGGRLRRVAGGRGPDLAMAGLVVVGAVLAVTMPFNDPEQELYPPLQHIAEVVAAEVEPGARYLVVEQGPLGFQFGPAVAYEMRRAGATAVMVGFDGRSAGDDYVGRGEQCAGVVRMVPLTDGQAEPDEGRVLVVVDLPTTDIAPGGRVAVTLAPDDQRRC